MSQPNPTGDLKLGAAALGSRVRVGSAVGVVIQHRGAVTELKVEEPDRVGSAWFSPDCPFELLTPAEASA